MQRRGRQAPELGCCLGSNHGLQPLSCVTLGKSLNFSVAQFLQLLHPLTVPTSEGLDRALPGT